MIKINLAQKNITLSQALNAALDVSGFCRKVPVAFVFQGVEFIVTCQHENVMVPQIVEPRMIKDFDDECLTDEFVRRSITSKDFALLLMSKINNQLRTH